MLWNALRWPCGSVTAIAMSMPRSAQAARAASRSSVAAALVIAGVVRLLLEAVVIVLLQGWRWAELG